MNGIIHKHTPYVSLFQDHEFSHSTINTLCFPLTFLTLFLCCFRTKASLPFLISSHFILTDFFPAHSRICTSHKQAETASFSFMPYIFSLMNSKGGRDFIQVKEPKKK